jgi:hypothetical protein
LTAPAGWHTKSAEGFSTRHRLGAKGGGFDEKEKTMNRKLEGSKNRKAQNLGTTLLLAVAAWLALPASNFTAQAQSAAARPVDLHRAEMEYRAMRERDENGNIPDNALVNAVQQAKQMSFDPQMWPGATQVSPRGSKTPVAGIDTNLWTWIGPGNIGGRIRAIVIHPIATNTIWVGGVDGGIWKTVNGGASWFPLNDFMANLAVSCMAIDPANPNVIYAGTGEPMYNIDSVRGAGIFKSTDGGVTWVQLSSTTGSSYNFVSRIAIDPNNSSNLLASTRSGIFSSINGGSSWTQTSTTEMLDIAFHPGNSSLAIASGYANAYYSLNGGVTWTAASGFPASTGYRGGRIEIAYAASSPNIVYASFDNASSGSGQVYVSNNGGQTYSLVGTPAHLSSQGWYDNCIWVDPTNPNIIVVGGTDLYRSSNGGSSWTDIGGYAGSVHPDQHAIVSMPGYNASTVSTVFIGNDGGFFRAGNIRTVSASSGWTTLNNNLGITQFYGAAGNSSSGTIVAGAQDNGTERVLSSGSTGSFTSMFGGDGGFCAADQSDPNYFYGEYVYLQIHRSSNGGTSSSYITGGLGDAGLPDTNGDFQVFYPPEGKDALSSDDPDSGAGGPPPDPDSAANFIAPFILDLNNFNTMLAGGSNLWRSVNVKAATPTWTNIKPGIASGSFINAIAVAPGNSDIIWVGHNSGAVYFTINGTSGTPTWTQSGSGTLPGRACTSLVVDSNNVNNVYATFGGYSSGNVYQSTDGGTTWANIGAALPSAPANSIVISPTNSNFIYVGMNVGVFASADGGATWSSGNLGSANVAVDQLFWMNNTLVAATHGRGLFKAAVEPLQILPTLGFFATGSLGGPFNNSSQNYVLTNIGSGPINWSLANTSAWLQVSATSGTLTPGDAATTVTVSLAPAATNLALGSYAASVIFTNTSDGAVQTREFSVLVTEPLQITPSAGFAATNFVGGPFSNTNQSYTLTNLGSASINWSLANTSAWLQASSTSGTLTPGAASTVVVSLAPAATNLSAGNYAATIFFTNTSDGNVQNRQFVLSVQTPPDPLVVAPASGLAFNGTPGAMSGASQTFNLTNTGVASANWSLRSTSVWFSASSSSGTLAPSGGATAVTLTTTPGANSLAVGSYTNTVWFTNQNTSVVQVRSVVLVVQSLLQNGGFEKGDFSSWTTSGNFQFCSVSSSATYVHSGIWGAEMGPSGTLGYLSQTLNTTPGQIYSLSFWLINPAGSTPNEFNAAWNGSTLVDLVNLGATGWVNYQYFVGATSSSTVIQFGFRNDPAYLGFDDVTVTPVPAPTFQSATRAGSDLNFSWNTQSGLVYQVQYTTSLNPPSWINLGGTITAGGSSLTFTDTNAISASALKFYRLEMLP